MRAVSHQTLEPDDERPAPPLSTSCCIIGAGPAGMMLGLLLARAGVDVVVLEKHASFLDDFRGDMIHPSTLELVHQLGALDDLLERPHQKAHQFAALIGDRRIPLADLSELPTRCRFIAFMPQRDFLGFLAGQARRYPTFHLRMQSEAVDLIMEDGRIAGARIQGPDGPCEVRAPLTVAADGRRSGARSWAGLEIDDLGSPIDVLWMRLSRTATDPQESFRRLDAGQIFVALDRGDYWQCALVIPKDGFEAVRQQGLPAFRERIARLAPSMQDRLSELADWDDVKLLAVTVSRLPQWYRPGLLCIGDASHAMSPVTGVGINLAIQDAVAAANILAEPLRAGVAPTSALRQVQQRRSLPTRLMHVLQLFMQNGPIRHVLASRDRVTVPLFLRLLDHCPPLRRMLARAIAMGFRPERILTPDILASAPHDTSTVHREPASR